MADFKPSVQPFDFGTHRIRLLVPGPEALRQHFEAAESQPVPYWARVWPAAIALCRYLTAHTYLVTGRDVLELAAGLGLPGLLAAAMGARVTLSDYLPEAVRLMEEAIALNGLAATSACLLDWCALPEGLTPDVLLLSDVNYEPAAFAVLYEVLIGFLARGTTIVLATPQRLMARPFVERLLPCCVAQEEVSVDRKEGPVFVSVLVLQ